MLFWTSVLSTIVALVIILVAAWILRSDTVTSLLKPKSKKVVPKRKSKPKAPKNET